MLDTPTLDVPTSYDETNMHAGCTSVTPSHRTEPSPGDLHRTARILMIGPGPDQMGGMASVVQQIVVLQDRMGVAIDFLPITHSLHGHESYVSRLRRHGRQVSRLQDILQNSRPDVVHIHTCSGMSFFRSAVDMLTAQNAGVPCVLHIHGAKFDQFIHDEPPWRRRMVKSFLETADAVVVLSNGWAQKLHGAAPDANLHVIENAVFIPPRFAPPRSSDICTFALLARMDTWKGIDDALAACRMLLDQQCRFRFILAGSPGTAGDADSLTQRIASFGLANTVRYVGELQGQAKEELLAKTDVYVQPSHSEGMPIALLEALAAGIPIVATAVGAVPEVLINGVHGLVVPPQQPDLLASAMSELVRKPELRRRFGCEARSLAEVRFSTNRFADDLRSFYDELLGAGLQA